MRKAKGFWIDDNNNKWSIEFTEETAIELSKSLHYCKDCTNCKNCWNCWNCQNCQYCNKCENCDYCWDCYNCNNCRSCQHCQSCRNCQKCYNCQDCWNCLKCEYCQDCRDFIKNPNRYIGEIRGDKNSQIATYWTEDKTQVVCDCWNGTLGGFEDMASEICPGEGRRNQYADYIAIVRKIMEMEPFVERDEFCIDEVACNCKCKA